MDSISFSPLPVVLGCFTLYTVGGYVYNVFFHPLRHVPGPWFAGMSRLWIGYQDIKFQKAQAIHAAFQKYGNVVRIEPNVVAFLDPNTTRVVYSATSQFGKSPFYKALLTNENDHAMTTLPPAEHVPKKRAYAPHYTPNNLSLYQPEIREYVMQMMSKLDEYEGKRAFDCLILFRRMMVDIIFVSSYGARLDSLKQWDIETFKDDAVSPIVEAINLFPIRGVSRSKLPSTLWNLIIKIPVAGWQKVVQSDRKIASYVIRERDAIVAKDMRLDSGDYEMDGETDERLSLIHRLLRQQVKAKFDERLTDEGIVSEGMGHTIAGVDTTATTLTYMMYILALRPDVLAKLREEIDPLMPVDGHDGERISPDYFVLNKLTYLTCFIKEVLRLYGAVPSFLERVVPDSLHGELVIEGYKIPPGTIVGTQAYSTHRVESVFPEPEVFKPERWLDETEEMRSAMIPFGLGGRLCGGMNLAHFTLRIALAATVRNFDIVIPPETTPESMEMRYAFVLLPASQRANLIFVPRKDLA